MDKNQSPRIKIPAGVSPLMHRAGFNRAISKMLSTPPMPNGKKNGPPKKKT